MDLSSHAEAVLEVLRDKHDAREQALASARQATRHAANAIRAVHRGDAERAGRLITEAAAELGHAEQACAAHPDVTHAGFLHDGQKEYAEAVLTAAIVSGREPGGPDDVGVPPLAWLHGLAETVGELRRHALDLLRTGRLQDAEAALEAMEEIYAVLATIDFPEGLTAGLRRATDVARSIIERTRGDVTTALLQERLRDALDAHRRDVLGD